MDALTTHARKEEQPEIYTTAVVIWNILKKKEILRNGLGPGFRLFEARNESKWFPAAHPSMKIKKLYSDETDSTPFLFAVDENSEYAVSTLMHADHERDTPVRLKGIILSKRSRYGIVSRDTKPFSRSRQENHRIGGQGGCARGQKGQD